MKFLLIIAHDDSFQPTQSLLSDIHEWVATNSKSGVRVHGNPLQPRDTATTVRIRDGKEEVSTGTFSNSKEQICAYELVDCKDRQAAVEISLSHPMAKAATIEVRPIWSELAQ
jgi:hypothetical protein